MVRRKILRKAPLQANSKIGQEEGATVTPSPKASPKPASDSGKVPSEDDFVEMGMSPIDLLYVAHLIQITSMSKNWALLIRSVKSTQKPMIFVS